MQRDIFAGENYCESSLDSDLISLTPVGGNAKRILDIFIAGIALFILWPLLLGIALLLLLTVRGPIFYVHRRVGHNGKEFNCLKFRTMARNSEKLLEDYLKENPEALREWQVSRKLKYDPRVTAIGSALRKLSLDELPQLFNILIGDMSVVGPRPVPRQELKLYGTFSKYYMSARPGLTGAWQISGRSNTSYNERIALDTSYVCNWSFWTDIRIIVQTVPVVLTARGSC